MDATFFEREVVDPSRRPAQRRSESTFHRIRAAALELITEEGYVAASTNRIAQRADVSIASLYRYFPNRQSIAVSLYKEASEQLGQLVHEWVARNTGLPPERTMAGLIDLITSFMKREHVVVLRMRDDVPELRNVGRGMLLDALGTSANLDYLKQQFGALNPDQLRCKLYFVQTLAMSMICRYVMDRPDGLSQPAFVEELTRVVVAYLNLR